MIEIKAWFGDWKEVTKEYAQEFIKDFISRMTVGNEEHRIKQAEKHLRGITYEQLFQRD